jgi:3',5'-cyclic-AMP phosphodiesterase
MLWAGTGVLWTLSGGVPKSSELLGIGSAQAAGKAIPGFSFLQISDSHGGFNKPANPDALGTLKEAIGMVSGLPVNPAFMIHTGDITHLSKPGQFDDAEKVIGEAKLDVHYVPGEHDLVDEENGKAYLDRFGKNTKGTVWYSFDAGGVHFIGLVNVANL